MARVDASVNPQAVSAQSGGASDQSIVADYTEAVVPRHAKRSNLRVFLLFMSMRR